VLKIWGRLNSINVQKVVLCAEELGLSYERVDAGMSFGVVNTPEYRSRNPNGLVPTLDDDGFVLWESNSIVRYLCASQAQTSFYPSDPRRRAEIEKWMDWQLSVLNAPIGTLFWGLVRSPGSRRPEDVEEARGKAETAMSILDRLLAHQAWISGESIGMADFVIGPILHRWLNLPASRPSLVEIARYYDSLMGRASARGVLTLPMT
jgi:glutathione S-transferase